MICIYKLPENSILEFSWENINRINVAVKKLRLVLGLKEGDKEPVTLSDTQCCKLQIFLFCHVEQWSEDAFKTLLKLILKNHLGYTFVTKTLKGHFFNPNSKIIFYLPQHRFIKIEKRLLYWTRLFLLLLFIKFR